MATADPISRFLTDGVYLRGWSSKTVETYRLSRNRSQFASSRRSSASPSGGV